jgi:ribosomal protein S18 acetylase RimI-like enzyme
MSGAAFRARLATAEDGARLVRLAAAVAGLPLLVRYGVDATRLGEELRASASGGAPNQALLVAEATDEAAELCGFARVLLSGQFGRGGYLKLIALRPGCEGRGIGQLLLGAVERSVAERSPDLFLLTSDFNDGAQRFYARAGYARVGELPDFVRPGITELIYWKRLR